MLPPFFLFFDLVPKILSVMLTRVLQGPVVGANLIRISVDPPLVKAMGRRPPRPAASQLLPAPIRTIDRADRSRRD